MIDNALKVCQEFLESREHSDIDISLETSQTLTQEEWAEFIDSYHLVVQWVQCMWARGKGKLVNQSGRQDLTTVPPSLRFLAQWRCRDWEQWSLCELLWSHATEASGGQSTAGHWWHTQHLDHQTWSYVQGQRWGVRHYQTAHRISAIVLADLLHLSSRYQMHQASGSDPRTCGPWSNSDQGEQVGGAEIPRAPLADPRHQIWCSPVVPGHRLEPPDCLVL